MEPVRIEIDESVQPVQQKRRLIPQHYLERFKAHLQELVKQNVITGLLGHDTAKRWIHNPVTRNMVIKFT